MIKTKLFALILSLLMVISALPVNVLATPSAVEVSDTAEEHLSHDESAKLSSEAVTSKYVKVHSLD